MNLREKFCEACGTKTFTETAKFCSKCGTELPLFDEETEIVSTLQTAQYENERFASFYPLSRWRKALTAALSLFAFALVAVGATSLQIASLGNDFSLTSLRHFDQLISQLETALGGVVLAGIASIVVLAGWSWIVTKNAHSIGKPERSPGWAALSWFCPLANIFVPYANLKEVWEISENAAPNPSTKEPPLLLSFAGFWGLTFLSSFVREEPTSLVEVSSQLNLAAILCFGQAATVVLLIKSVWAITARQESLPAK